MRSDVDSSGDADSSTDTDSSSLPDCPRCGEPVGFVTATGPHTGTASPCGCSVPPGLLERDREE
ncbi:hypothetical protein [Natrinema versiforme]|uniref:Small CPxCG-related zinc finger protein n=1 Tax=Natrinema versiforme TaxID=88724 RepID=A0A4P8WHU0_9EURY|nr:hypothetical protein [Natrinema versiforme]QCS43028.1 hypothetical protein FEJ81_11920 [Natrinema versiforme]